MIAVDDDRAILAFVWIGKKNDEAGTNEYE
jgi:hypothetical protein